MDLDRLIDFYQTLTPESVGRLPELYSTDASFKDPFNEVRGVTAILHIFTHMFQQVEAPRFVVTDRIAGANAAMLVWEFSFRMRRWKRSETQRIRGVSHLKFAADGKIDSHRDYWDAAEELYMKLPVIGYLMSGLRQMLSASG